MKRKMLAALSAASFLLASCGGGEPRTLEDDVVQYESIYYWHRSQIEAEDELMSLDEICESSSRSTREYRDRFADATWTPEIQADVDQLVAAVEEWIDHWDACEERGSITTEALGTAVGTLMDSLGVEAVEVGSTWELRRR